MVIEPDTLKHLAILFYLSMRTVPLLLNKFYFLGMAMPFN